MIGTRRSKARWYLRQMMTDGRGGLNEKAITVLGHLRRFTGATKTPMRFSRVMNVSDPMSTGVAIGMAMVYQEICDLLYLDEKERTSVGTQEDET